MGSGLGELEKELGFLGFWDVWDWDSGGELYNERACFILHILQSQHAKSLASNVLLPVRHPRLSKKKSNVVVLYCCRPLEKPSPCLSQQIGTLHSWSSECDA